MGKQGEQRKGEVGNRVAVMSYIIARQHVIENVGSVRRLQYSTGQDRADRQDRQDRHREGLRTGDERIPLRAEAQGSRQEDVIGAPDGQLSSANQSETDEPQAPPEPQACMWTMKPRLA